MGSNPRLMRTINQTIHYTQQVPFSDVRDGGLNIQNSLRGICSGNQQGETGTSFPNAPLLASSCTCRIVNQTTQVEILPFIHFRKVMRRNHYCHCPKLKVSERSLEYLMTIILPLWLLAHTINFSMALRQWGSNRGWNISPIVLGASRIVDPATSPAFRAIQQARKHLDQIALESLFSRGQGIIVESLGNTIRDLIRDRKASAFDEDCYGSILLYVCNFKRPRSY